MSENAREKENMRQTGGVSWPLSKCGASPRGRDYPINFEDETME
jgi:hypothetical protein